MATSRTPYIPSSWIKRGPVFPQFFSRYNKTCCGGLLLRDDIPHSDHLLFWGCTEPECGQKGIYAARTKTPEDPTSYKVLDTPVLPLRPGFFDATMLQGKITRFMIFTN
jgi:hypothetical protein